MTNINRVNLDEFVFDHDLTLAILLANSDGTVYHRYGGRTAISPMNMETLVGIMREGLKSHRDYSKAPRPPVGGTPLFLEDLVRDRLKGRMHPVFGCYHCHYAREAKQYLRMEVGKWTPDQYWIFPPTERIGVVMDQLRQNEVAKVLADSPAERAGFRKGDVLERLADSRVLTKYDIQWVLHGRQGGTERLPFTLRRGDRVHNGSLALEPHWKVGDPREYAWRVRNVYTEHMTKFLPAPGFTGERLSSGQLVARGLAKDRFAFVIGELNYGTYLAGIRLGDVILAAGGRSEFETDRDFYAWCESLRSAGRDIRMEVFRQGSAMNVMVPLSSLNYSKVEKAPRAVLGFILQQLSGKAGVRVGNVTDGCSAERAGIVIGDRIARVEGHEVSSREAVLEILHNKSPGDLLTIDVVREGKPLQLGFVLGGESARRSRVARLSEPTKRAGQLVDCVVTVDLPADKHIYSIHRKGFGVPTQLMFRGEGYELVGPVNEPNPVPRGKGEGVETMWIHEGRVEIRQRIRVTDVEVFRMLVQVYAQVCDEVSCHEFRAVVGSDGRETHFSDYRGRFLRQPLVGKSGEMGRSNGR